QNEIKGLDLYKQVENILKKEEQGITQFLSPKLRQDMRLATGLYIEDGKIKNDFGSEYKSLEKIKNELSENKGGVTNPLINNPHFNINNRNASTYYKEFDNKYNEIREAIQE